MTPNDFVKILVHFLILINDLSLITDRNYTDAIGTWFPVDR